MTVEELNTLVADASLGVKQMITEIDNTLQYAKKIFRHIEEREYGRERHN